MFFDMLRYDLLIQSRVTSNMHMDNCVWTTQRPGLYCKTCSNKSESPPPPTDRTKAITAQCQDFGIFRPGMRSSSSGFEIFSPDSENSLRLRDGPGLIIQRGREVKRSCSAAEDLSAF